MEREDFYITSSERKRNPWIPEPDHCNRKSSTVSSMYLLLNGSSVRTRISKWGNSLAVRLPKPFMDELGLGEGAEVEITLRDGQLVLSAAGREYALKELVEGITADNRHQETDWGRPRGREVW